MSGASVIRSLDDSALETLYSAHSALLAALILPGSREMLTGALAAFRVTGSITEVSRAIEAMLGLLDAVERDMVAKAMPADDSPPESNRILAARDAAMAIRRDTDKAKPSPTEILSRLPLKPPRRA